MKTKVLVLFGGVSNEHDVSLISACSVIKKIPTEKYEVLTMGITKQGVCYLYSGDADSLPNSKWLVDKSKLSRAVISCDREHHGIINLDTMQIEKVDVVFPVLHGKNGEDGTIQGLLEISGIPFVGCKTAASAVCMDKSITNAMLDFLGIKQAKWTAFNNYQHKNDAPNLLENASNYLQFPIFVKPAKAGSSVGISKAKNFDELKTACEVAFKYDDKVVLEQNIIGKEVECAVMGNDEPIASVVGEIVPCNDFYDYDAKYLANESELHIPARLSQKKIDEIRTVAVDTYKALGCTGLTRVDFFVTDDGEVFLNELNTIPGFTPISMYPKMFAASGVEYSQLIEKLISYALEK